jgi:5-methylcytosine-specific restriction endonuclease McrA
MNCIYCNKEIIGRRKDAKYCSKECRYLDYSTTKKLIIKKQRAEWYLKNRERERKRSDEWYKNHRESEIEKNKEYRKQNKELFNWYHDKDRFNGVRDIILEIDKKQCQLCGTDKKLCVHHIDGSGYTSKKKNSNNDIENLITLCKSCHTKLHWWQRKNRVLTSREDIVRSMAKVIEISRND